ncbi:SIR2 family protein [Paraburkholderia sp. BCC1876]|uniref:SIR2 family protein n=1 Tax=Paraburkholderia sp. BCC1876 TaxID=2676303 RepID=UPI001591F917|nr:SIR2 family protein [Paraburkholderia sp. BCC1876]
MNAKNELRNTVSQRVLERYPREIVHMREQFKREQFGLVFGAGIGRDLGFPIWKELLKRIAHHVDVTGQEIFKKNENNSTLLAQQLFQRYKRTKQLDVNNAADTSRMLEMKIRAGWRKIVRDCLYQDVPSSIEEILKKDRYLLSFAPIMSKMPLTVTYNFDDVLERLLKSVQPPEAVSKGSRTFWSGNVQLHPKNGGVIYHPNGYLPSQVSERPSDHLVFAEDSFADQLIDSMAGHYASLATHFSQTTCLLTGLSLDDPTLKHLLRATANSFPGHFHYYINFVSDPTEQVAECDQAQAAANFEVFNLITLNLTAEEISALAQLISASDDDFSGFAEEHIKHQSFRFFVVGSVGAGKSTTVSHFRSMLTQDEWTEERAPGMEKAADLLTPEETAAIDEWVASQVAKKNLKLLQTSGHGIHVIDRAPLDAFAFTPPDGWSEKAKRLVAAVSPGTFKKRELAAGHVIFLRGDPEVMAQRAVSLSKIQSAEKLNQQQSELLHIYDRLSPKEGFTIIDTVGKTVTEVVREVADIIFRKPYEEANLQRRLEEIEKKGYES